MDTFTLFLLCALVLAAANCNPLTDVITTSCNVDFDGASRKLTCHFDVDLNKTKLDCTVQRYNLDPNDRDPDRVASCNWKPTDELSCHAYGSYELKLNGPVAHTVVIDLPETEPEGRYLCQVITNGKKKQHFCTWKQPDGNSASRTNLDDRPSVDFETTSQGSTQNTEGSITVIVVVCVIASSVFTALIVTLVALWKRHRRPAEKNATSPPDCVPRLLKEKVDCDCNKNYATDADDSDNSSDDSDIINYNTKP